MAIQNDYNIYPTEYFSGSDVYIFFNNKMIYEIISLQFNISENIIPIHGYASYTYDAVARGSRIVTGSFRINFVESMYIYTLLGQMSDEAEGNIDIEPRLTNNREAIVENNLERNLTAEDISHAVENGKLSYLKDQINTNENRLWGSGESAPIIKYRTPHFTNNVSREFEKKGFDIILSYGDEQFSSGQVLDEIPSTVKVINGVHITGVSQVVQPTGEAIFEEYTFIAQDTDNTINLRK